MEQLKETQNQLGKSRYKRILLKLSGEVLAGEKGAGIDMDKVTQISRSICDLYDLGVELAVVVGGGNIWRGRTSEGMDRVTADHMGMLATSINALALSDAILQLNHDTRVMSAIAMQEIAETYIRKRALRHLEKGRIVIFACGIGNPYFSTDTTAALRAAEIGADVIFKATNVDGIFDKDPKRFDDAKLYSKLTHQDVLQKELRVMDATAAALCRDNHIDIAVFNLDPPENIVKMALGELEKSTLVY
jgi:uridylate kinase